MEPTVAQAGPAAAPAPTGIYDTIPDSDTFLLNSKPGANRVIYLDFDGETISGTAWNSSTGGACYAEPFDANSSPGTWSASELNTIKSVWRRVAEDYAWADVNVTTQDPGAAAILRTDTNDLQYGTRALITYSQGLCPNGLT